MELKDLLKLLDKNKRTLAIFMLTFGLLGIFSFWVLPKRYSATGSFFVQRKVEEPSDKYFAYQGYYAQQTAINYANTFATLLVTDDIKQETLIKLKIPVTEATMRNFNRDIAVKKAAPQLITLTISAYFENEAKDKWNTLSQTTLDKVKLLNASGDALINISQLETSPIVKENFRNVFLNLVIGIALGFIVGLSVIYFKIALKEK